MKETDSSLKALNHGLDTLRLLLESRTPLSATEIARKIGLHQSSVSRILKALTAAGYVRKPAYHSFAVDYGVLTLGNAARAHFPLVDMPRAIVQELAEQASGMMVVVATVWRGQLVYFLRAQKDQEQMSLSTGGYPLHLSAVALRLLLDLPEDEALSALEDSRRRYGWERPTPRVPAEPKALLDAARKLLKHDCLMLENWQGEGRIVATNALECPNEPRATLSLTGTAGVLSHDQLIILLQEGRRKIEGLMREQAAA
jgi:DNA-binding IclR family transcriptional regulator